MRLPLLDELLKQKGVATTVKVTLIGRPGQIRQEQDTVILAMSHIHKLPLGLPKGVPQPPAEPTIYTIYIGNKQWHKVEASIAANPEDALVIEGACSFDPALQGMAVFATNVTTKFLQRTKK